VIAVQELLDNREDVLRGYVYRSFCHFIQLFGFCNYFNTRATRHQFNFV
jgi:hypothetical protein